MRIRDLALLGAIVLAPSIVAAQEGPGPRTDLGVGLRWIGPTQFGEVTGSETSFGGANAILFSTRSSLQASPGIEVRTKMRLMSQLFVESSVGTNRTQLATRVDGDFEHAPDTTAREDVTQFSFEAGISTRLTRWCTSRMTPFLAGGVGYSRQLHSGHTLIESGRAYYAGGGFDYVLGTRERSRVQATGIRLDARATWLQDGINLDGATHVIPTLGASFFVRF